MGRAKRQHKADKRAAVIFLAPAPAPATPESARSREREREINRAGRRENTYATSSSFMPFRREWSSTQVLWSEASTARRRPILTPFFAHVRV